MRRVGADRVPATTTVSPDPAVVLSPYDYFLLSRIDGRTTLRVLRQIAGTGEAEFDASFTKLIAAGLARVPGVQRDDALSALGLDAGAAPPAATIAPPSAAPPAPAPPAPSPRTPAAASASAAVPEAGPPSAAAPVVSTAPVAAPVQEDSDVDDHDDDDDDPLDVVPPTGVGERYEAVATRQEKAVKASTPRLTRELIPRGWPIPFQQFTFDPETMATGPALDGEQKQVVLYYHYHLQRVSYYDLLGLPSGASRRDVKLAYFRLSKAFHPDRWYRKETGEFGDYIEDVFKWLNRAYGVLSSPTKRRGYDKLIARGYVGEWQLEGPVATQAKRAHPPQQRGSGGDASGDGRAGATDARRTMDALLLKARALEAAADWSGAVDLYNRAISVSPSADLRIRLVECMLKATMDPAEIDQHIAHARAEGAEAKGVLLLEAEVARRLGDVIRAESAYRGMLALEPSNPVARLGLEKLGASVDSADQA